MSDAKIQRTLQGTIYCYFESKEKLFEEILRIADRNAELKQLKVLTMAPMPAKSKMHILSESVLKQLCEDEMFAARLALNTQIFIEQNKTSASGSETKLADYYWGVVYLYALRRLFTTKYEIITAQDFMRVYR